MIKNGLRVVVGRGRETTSSIMLNKVIAFAATAWNKIKSAANAVASFCYSALQFGLELPGKMFSSISSYAAPYVKQAGEFIMKIARPLLNTRIGKAAVAGMSYVKKQAVNATYKVVDGAEWLIDKSTLGVNWLAQQATDLTNWIGQTRAVQFVTGVAKSAASWISSTSLFQSAIDMTVYVFTKMSNFCTAIAESYQYYNQCRTIARRIVNDEENNCLVDEHTLIKAFHGVVQQEAKAINQNANTDEVSRVVFIRFRILIV
jgi:hypothetical protein